MAKTIGVLTGGGDVPGLNPCMKALVLNAMDFGMTVYGIRRGWGGLLNYNLDEPSTHDYYIKKLTREDVRREFPVFFSDLDINRHANNVAYATWAVESVPVEVAMGCMLTGLEIAYRAEVFHGETVLSRCGDLSGGSTPVFLHQLVRREDGAELTRLVSRWREQGRCAPTC